MPESAEVRIVADWLKSNLQDCVIRSVEVAGKFVKRPIARIEELNHKRVIGVRCRGKVIAMDTESDISIVSTLGMTGLWTHDEMSHTAIRMMCERPPTRGMFSIYYVDQRRFGNFKVVDTHSATSKLDSLGWDPLAEPTAYGKVKVRALKYKNKKTPVCEVLLDQDVFAGCGNYLRAETMYRAGVDPWMEWRNLSTSDVDVLCTTLAEIVAESYKNKGASLENFVDGDGNKGEYVGLLKVYGKKKDPDGRDVLRRKDSKGRTVWWVER
jgi:DNA-formamidopyrimidine glycosylase